jgi:hypothetical protein
MPVQDPATSPLVDPPPDSVVGPPSAPDGDDTAPAATDPDPAAAGEPTVRAEEEAGTFRDGFETDEPVWRQEEADPTSRLLAHDRTDRARRGGQRSEHFAFESAGTGLAFYYSYALPKIPLAPDLEASLYARANQPGVQILAQVILPADTDPATGQPSFVRVAGTSTDVADRWQRLELAELKKAVEAQVRILRIQTRRPVPLEGAYLDRIVVNLDTGPGETEVFLDDLRVSPVPSDILAKLAADPGDLPNADPALPELPSGAAPAAIAEPGSTPADVRLEGGRLTRSGRDWAPTLLRAPGADLEQALAFGFDVVALAADADPAQVSKAVGQGALLMPDLGAVGDPDLQPPDPAMALDAMRAFPRPESVAFWDLGHDLGRPDRAGEANREQAFDRLSATLEAIHSGDAGPATLATGTVVGDFANHAMTGRSLDLIGVDPRWWGSCLEPLDVLEYYKQRRDLTALWNASIPYWAWVDAGVPPSVRAAVWGTDVPPPWGLARVQPEQVRLGAFLALMAGYRAVGFRADGELTREGGRPVLYEMGLLNAEIDLVEPLIAQGADPIQFLATYPPDPLKTQAIGGMPTTQSGMMKRNTSVPKEFPPHPSIKATSIPTRDGRTRLVLVADVQGAGQLQPGQMAFNDLKVVIPGVPPNAQAMEIRLGGGRWLERDRVPGGVRFSIPEFGVATMLVVTTDTAYGDQLRREIQRVRPRSVDLALRQARQQIEVATDINNRLALDGITSRDAADLLALASRSLETAEAARNAEDYELAWDEARRVGRPVRLLMRAHYEQAQMRLVRAVNDARDRAAGLPPAPTAKGVKDPYKEQRLQLPRILVQPTASPALVAWQTLPQHYVWCSWAESGTFGRNLIADGSFGQATPESLVQAGWSDAGTGEARLDSSLRLLEANGPHDGDHGQVVRLSVRSKAEGGVDRASAFLDHMAAAIQTPPVAVQARQFVRITAMVKMPRNVPAGVGGLIVRDSIGGEPLQFRTAGPVPDWAQVVLYRRIPADSMLTVTIGLAGYGDLYVDDVAIERLEQLPAGLEVAAGSGTGVPPQPQPAAPAVDPTAARPGSTTRRVRLR